jgi:hypothetical protein
MPFIMKSYGTQKEILLLTATSFAARQYSEKDEPENAQNIPGKEKLKDACWNGLLKEMLPEVFLFNEPGAKLFLWQVREARQFFALEMSEYPKMVDKYLSVDPYRFMEVQEFN